MSLLHLDRYGDAELLLPLVEALTDPANELDGIRLRWLQGRTRRLVKYLYLAQSDPGLKFKR